MTKKEFASTLKTYAGAARQVESVEMRIGMCKRYNLDLGKLYIDLDEAELECIRLYKKLIKAYGETR